MYECMTVIMSMNYLKFIKNYNIDIISEWVYVQT